MLLNTIKFLAICCVVSGFIVFYGIFFFAYLSPDHILRANININSVGEADLELVLMTLGLVLGIPIMFRVASKEIDRIFAKRKREPV